MLDNQERNKRPDGRTRTLTSEYEGPFKALLKLKALEDEEIKAQWKDYYVEEYKKADIYREKGDHKNALEGYKRSRKIIHLARERGCEEDWILVREATLHYMIIQCYSNLQKDPDIVMREFHNFGVVLNEFIELLFQNRPEMQDDLDELRRIHISENYIKIETLLEKLEIFDETQTDLSVEELVNLWLCAYFFTRFTNSIHDFFLKSTALIDVASKYNGICKTAGKIAKNALKRIPSEHIDSNPSLVAYRDLMKWLEGFDDFLMKDISHELGEEEEEEGGNKDEARSTVELKALQLNIDNIDKDNPTDRKGYEYALEIGVQDIFDKIVKEEAYYFVGIDSLKEKAQIAIDNGFKRVAIKAYIYICRASMLRNLPDDAKNALDLLHELKETEANDINQEVHVFDRWILTLEVEVKLLEFMTINDIDETCVEQREQIESVIALLKIQDIHPSVALEEIEAIFARYKLDNDSQPPKLSYKPLDAKIYYLLGVVAIEKVKILGDQYQFHNNEDHGFDKGQELLQGFIDAVRYLSEAFVVLDDMQFKGKSLKNLIGEKYEEVLALNYQIFGTQKRDHKENTKKTTVKGPEIDMKEVAREYQVQKLTRMLYTVLLNQNDAEGDDPKAQLESALNEMIQTNYPNISNVSIVEGQASNPLHQEAIENFKNGKTTNYFYNRPGGTITQVLLLDDNPKKYLVLDMDIKITCNVKEVIKEMVCGIKQCLRIEDLKPTLDDLYGKEDRESKGKYIETKNMVLEAYDDLCLNLLRRHKPTLRHSIAIGDMQEQNALDLIDEHGYELHPQIAYYAGRAHDIGKIFLNNQMLLDMARRFQDFEKDAVQQHIVKALNFQRHVIGFKHFKEIACITGAHHVKYSFEEGYPFVLPGKHIENIPQQINMVLGLKPGDEDYMEGVLSPCYCALARMIPLDDMMQALRSHERLYRDGPRPIDDLIKSIVSRSGSEFDPDAVILRLKQLRAGKFTKILAQSEEDKEFLLQVQGPEKTFPSSDVWRFVDFMQDDLETLCGAQLDTFKGKLMQGLNANLKMTVETLGRDICGIIMEEKGKTEGYDHYHQIKDEFFRIFNAWTEA